jgi:phosphomannomutase/phosphoglucomutase
MLVPAHVFREYDIRGIADRELSSELAIAIGAAFGTALLESRAPQARQGPSGAATEKPLRVAVGRDCRLSSPRLFDALTVGLRQVGIDVVDVGIGPTPMLYFAVHHLDADGGVMITGSHNPSDENGFKLMKGKASFYADDIRRLRDHVALGPPPTRDRKGTMQAVDVSQAYVDRMSKGIDLSASGLSVVIDAGNGSAGPLGLAAVRRVGLDPVALYCDMDGRFPNHHPDPTVPSNLTALIAKVKEVGAQVGIAWDGDGDRIGAIDASGEVIWGDKLMILFSRDLLASHPGAAILGEVKCSQTLYDDIARHGGRPILWKTGHSNIKTKMKEEGALLAGEMSGHLFFADRYFGYDDGIYAALRLLEIVARSKKTLAELLADVPTTFVTPELRVSCPDPIKFEVVGRVLERYRDRHEVIDVDGARILFGDGAWGLVRASNTGPVLVMRFEAKSEARRDELRAQVEAAVAEECRALSG